MAKPPWWMKLEPTGTTEEGNAGYRMRVAWWFTPVAVIYGLIRILLFGMQDNPSDGIEITDVGTF